MATSSLTRRQLEETLADAYPFSAESAVITTTTNVAVKAAVTSKRHWVTQLVVTNKTATEMTQVIVQSNTTTIATLAATDPVTASPGGSTVYKFDPPLEFASGEAINAKTVDATTGDIHVLAVGYLEA